MADDFFNNGDKAYSENLNDAILVGNSFDWMVSVDLPGDTGGVFPNSSSVVKAKVVDVSAAPNSNLGIGSAISNNSGSEQVYRLTVYPNFNRFGGFASVSLTADSGVSFYLANKGASSPIVSNLDYSDLGSVPELKVLKEYDIVLSIPSGKSVSGLSFVLQSKSASVSASISQGNVAGLLSSLSAEASARQEADEDLQEQIDELPTKDTLTSRIQPSGWTGNLYYRVRSGWVFLQSFSIRRNSIVSSEIELCTLPDILIPESTFPITTVGYQLSTGKLFTVYISQQTGKVLIKPVSDNLSGGFDLMINVCYPLKEY